MFKLVREETPEELAIANRHQWPVRITATFTEDDSEAPIFVMQEAAPGEFAADNFSCVASAQQMEDLPLDAPGPSSPFYRVPVVTALCRSATAAAEFAEKIEYATQDLADNLAAAAILAVVAETIITPDV